MNDRARIRVGAVVLDPASRLVHGPMGSARLFPQSVRVLESLARAGGTILQPVDLIAAMDAPRPRHPDVDRRQVLRNVLLRTRKALAGVGAPGLLAGEKRGYEGWRIAPDGDPHGGGAS